MKFSFLILTWNRSRFLELCLQRLQQSIHSGADCEVVVMDNGSSDATASLLRRMQAAATVPLRVVTLPKHLGLNAYRKLFRMARGEYMVVVDDDVLEFPHGIDLIFEDYMRTFTDYGYLALNVVQNEHTNGAKPGPEHYTEVVREGRVVQLGPTGGWCSCLRRSDYRKLWRSFLFTKFNMKTSEDGFLVGALQRRLGLKSGIIRDHVCLHASGPYYAAQYGHLDREIAKYRLSGMDDFVQMYEQYRPAADEAAKQSAS